MRKKIFLSIIAVAMTVLVLSLVIASSFYYDYFKKQQINQLKEELEKTAQSVEQYGKAFLENRSSSTFRYTLISNDGSVIFDSQASANDMENHLLRSEIAQALKTGYGSSARYSSTLTERTFYEACKLSDDSVLRVSATQLTIGALFMGISPAVALIVIVCIVVSILLSERMAKAIVKPLRELDLENPIENDCYEELSPILRKISKQHQTITSQLIEIKKRADEFEQITSSMSEGLIVLDEKKNIVSINAAARSFFNASSSVVGGSFLTLDRSIDMNMAIEKAFEEKHFELKIVRDERIFKFILSRTESEGKTTGLVIIAIDITEEENAQQRRQEFTANVSHELKTPLQSIIGSAELLENGLVKEGDTKAFASVIRKEASRLVTLISDIIRLSQLDESEVVETESVDLLELCQEVKSVLSSAASNKNISLNVEGSSVLFEGNRRYLYEIIYNLCDNAIRYTPDGGKVSVNIAQNNGKANLVVSDTGIGIAKEHQSRIFERFYRVDKSHSKETGGTGLGLSIVKHAVAYHNGSIELESEVGKGTKVTVTL